MKIRALDKNWDWRWGHGFSDYASDSVGIAYSIKTKILSWYKDCFFDTEAGIDWKNLLGSKVSQKDIDSAVKKIVATEDGVTEITYFESGIQDRNYGCTVRFKTIYNETIEVKI